MSLINSFINQIGREMGRDVYNSLNVTTRYAKNNKTDYYNTRKTLKEELESLIDGFQISSQDKATISRLANIVDKAKNFSGRNSDFFDVFKKIDEKIDYSKNFISKQEYKNIIEKLDETNYQIFQAVSMKHRYWLENDVLPDYQILKHNYKKEIDRLRNNPPMFYFIFGKKHESKIQQNEKNFNEVSLNLKKLESLIKNLPESEIKINSNFSKNLITSKVSNRYFLEASTFKNLNIQIFDEKNSLLCENILIDDFSFECYLPKVKLIVYGLENDSKSVLVDDFIENSI